LPWYPTSYRQLPSFLFDDFSRTLDNRMGKLKNHIVLAAFP